MTSERKITRFQWGVIAVCITLLLLIAGGLAWLYWPPPARPFQLVKTGMTKTQVEAALGPPDWVENAGTPMEVWAYRDEGGIMGWLMPMYVPFDAKGKVEGPPYS